MIVAHAHSHAEFTSYESLSQHHFRPSLSLSLINSRVPSFLPSVRPLHLLLCQVLAHHVAYLAVVARTEQRHRGRHRRSRRRRLGVSDSGRIDHRRPRRRLA